MALYKPGKVKIKARKPPQGQHERTLTYKAHHAAHQAAQATPVYVLRSTNAITASSWTC